MSDASGGLEVRGLSKIFKQGGKELEILKGVSLEVRPGEMVALVGPSGAGKSTLLQCAGLLEQASGGEVLINGTTATKMGDDARTAMRRGAIGFIYQFHHLLPEFSALENVIIPQMIAGVPRRKAKTRSMDLLTAVGVKHRASHRPARLSGGEQQRVAIARALANRPSILLADEPTGNLDPDTSEGVFDMLTLLVRETKVAALIATHNLALADRMDRGLRLDHGGIEAFGT